MTIHDVVQFYAVHCLDWEPGHFCTDREPVVVSGAVKSVREHGRISFITIADDSAEVQLFVRERLVLVPTVNSIVTATGHVGKTSTDQLSVLVQHLTINTLAPPNIATPRTTPRLRNRKISKGEQLVIERAASIYGTQFPLGAIVAQTGDIDLGSLDPSCNIPDREDERRLAWAERKRPQVRPGARVVSGGYFVT